MEGHPEWYVPQGSVLGSILFVIQGAAKKVIPCRILLIFKQPL